VNIYPVNNIDRDRWIIARRPQREALDPERPVAFFVEDECAANGEVVSVATIFLTNRECPWRCVMCDLWRNTLTEAAAHGAIPAQIDYALLRLPPASQIKLYNSGSFFDPKAIPTEDCASIAGRLHGFERVIVESHPALVGETCLRLRDLLTGRLEVAMGLETVDPEVLSRLNKRMTLNQFSQAADFLRANDIDLRVFILVQPPFMEETESLYWAERSLDFAFDCGASVATLIPTRAGNGAMEELSKLGQFSPPRIETVEAAAAYGVALERGRVFADLWDFERLPGCTYCRTRRNSRLREMNLRQTIAEPVDCGRCGNKD
jgi:radical SAM enzyme (TIGR01210 family)